MPKVEVRWRASRCGDIWDVVVDQETTTIDSFWAGRAEYAEITAAYVARKYFEDQRHWNRIFGAVNRYGSVDVWLMSPQEIKGGHSAMLEMHVGASARKLKD